MHFYGFNIARYHKKTEHLTDYEDLAYRRMIDEYYDTERPLQGDAVSIARVIRLREHAPEVEAVLREFFKETPKGWRNQTCEEVLAEYRKTCRRNRENGKLGGRPRGSGSQPTGNPLGSQEVAGRNPPNPTPIPNPSTKKEKPPRGEGGGASPEFAGEGDRGPAGGGESSGLFAELCGTSVRSKSKNRRVALSRLAHSLAAQGMKPPELRALWTRARQESESEPGGLLMHWLENGWREKLTREEHR